MKNTLIIIQLMLITTLINAQSVVKSMNKLPDTGQTGDFTTTFGEDADYSINIPFFINNNNGTITDTITKLMWQQADGGEMTIEKAITYADTLTLGGYTDWRLPTAHESFSILNLQRNNPALDVSFTTSTAEYWWTNDKQANDVSKIWCTNAGGGIGNHPKTETISAGGTKKFHVRVVRDIKTPVIVSNPFTDNGNATIKDNLTGLTWQKTPNIDTLTWENALMYAENLTLSGFSDWRLPNIKELQSINDERLVTPSVSTAFFPTIGIKKYWSSTSLPNQTTRAWYLSTQFGITTYELKTAKQSIICVRGSSSNTTTLKDIKKPDLDVKIFPNPIKNNLIQCEFGDNSKDLLINIFDMQGCLVFNQHYTAYQYDKMFSMPVIGLKTGIYCLKIESEGHQIVKKIVIEK